MIPRRLAKGDKVGIVTASSPVTSDLLPMFEGGLKGLRALGFEPVVAKNALKVSGGTAGTPEERAADINAMFADKEIRAVIPAHGGATSNACLPYLDWKLIEQNPKIFIGMSDLTVFLDALYTKTGLVTFHGPAELGFSDLAGYDLEEFLGRVVEGKTGAVRPSGPRKALRKGTAEGTLLGGSLSRVIMLAGTPYWPDFRHSILFLEAMYEEPADLESDFAHLKATGVFDQVEGVVLGHGHPMTPGSPSAFEDSFLAAAGGYDFPVLKTDDFGHWSPNTVLPVGGQVRLDAAAERVEITRDCVSAGAGAA